MLLLIIHDEDTDKQMNLECALEGGGSRVGKNINFRCLVRGFESGSE
jgi:hypothetical protein